MEHRHLAIVELENKLSLLQQAYQNHISDPLQPKLSTWEQSNLENEIKSIERLLEQQKADAKMGH